MWLWFDWWCSLQNHQLVLKGGVFWRWLSHASRALMDGVRALIKGLEGVGLLSLLCEDTRFVPSCSSVLSTMWGHSIPFLGRMQQQNAILEAESIDLTNIETAGTLVVDSQPPELWERFLLFIDYWLPDILLQQQKTDWDIRILDKVIYAFFFVTISYNYGNFLLVLVFAVFELCVGTLFYARLCFNCIFSYFSGKFLPHFP